MLKCRCWLKPFISYLGVGMMLLGILSLKRIPKFMPKSWPSLSSQQPPLPLTLVAIITIKLLMKSVGFGCLKRIVNFYIYALLVASAKCLRSRWYSINTEWLLLYKSFEWWAISIKLFRSHSFLPIFLSSSLIRISRKPKPASCTLWMNPQIYSRFFFYSGDQVFPARSLLSWR